MLGHYSIGKPESRIDAIDKVTGQAQYANDLRFPGLLYAKVKRSITGHANILNVDTSKAERVPGVKAIVTGKEFSEKFSSPLSGNPLQDQPFLAFDRIRFAGEALAVVAATSEEAAEEAAELIDVEHDELPVILNSEDALKDDAVVIHPDLENYQRSPAVNPVPETNICDRIEILSGDLEQGFTEADYIFEDTFSTQTVQHTAMEPRVAIVQFRLDGTLFVWTSDQAPYGVRSNLAGALKIPVSKVRIIVPPYIGGGFGGKIRLTGLICSVAIAWKAKNRPVKLVLTRQEEFTSTSTRHASKVFLKTGVKKDGTIIARHAKLVYDTGAYADRGPTVLGKAKYAALGPYKIPNLKVEGLLVYTNKPPAGAFRGYGIPQVCWAHDQQMDIIAEKLGIDPVTIRRNNVVDEGYLSGTDKTRHHAVGLDECLVKVKEGMARWVAEEKSEKRNIKTGVGVACGYKISRTPSSADAFIKLSPDGGVDILVSSVEMGQGVNTILSQIAAEELRLPMDNIRVLPPDTFVTPMFPASTSSRTTFFMGNAVRQAALDIKSQLFELAEDILNTDQSNLSLEEGRIVDRSKPGSGIKLKEFIEMTYSGGANIMGRGNYCHYWPGKVPSHVKLDKEPSLCWQYAAHAARVEVDTDTGKINVLEVIAAHDVGRAINPANCEAQVEGGLVQAIGGVFFEEMLFGGRGRMINPSFADYKIPVSLDVPEIKTILVEEPHREGPYGAKGIGEITLVPIAPAIANAVYNAIGIRITALPITKEKILKALQERDESNKLF